MGLSSLGLIWEAIQIYALVIVSLLAGFDALLLGTASQTWGQVYSDAFTKWETLIVDNILA